LIANIPDVISFSAMRVEEDSTMTMLQESGAGILPDIPRVQAGAAGLDDVVVARTALSHVDGAAGRLVIAGLPLRVLAGRSVEDVAARLWRAAGAGPAGLPTDPLLTNAQTCPLGEARRQAHALLPRALAAAGGLEPMDGLIAAVAVVGGEGAAGSSGEPALPAHIRLAGALGVLVPALLRRAGGEAALAPDPQAGHAADMLRMIHGRRPATAEVAALERYLVTVSDHGMNASTFAARVVASTRAGMTAAVVAGLCALKGPLHGGAPGPVLDMLDEAAAQPDLAVWIRARLANGERIMGFGHRIYRVRDPRADALREAVAALASPRLEAAARLEAEILSALAAHRPGRALETNVEYMTALLLDALRIPRAGFTTIFAAGRVFGWTAHVLEQERTGRLMRPRSDYVGPDPDLDQREADRRGADRRGAEQREAAPAAR